MTGTLGELASAFKNALPQQPPANAVEADAFLDEARNTEKMILATHSVWAFFRKKFSQRLEPGFQQPFRRRRRAGLGCSNRPWTPRKSPDWSRPWYSWVVLSAPSWSGRDKAYLPEDVPPRFLDLKEFKDLVSRLPVPVIGVPWAQSGTTCPTRCRWPMKWDTSSRKTSRRRVAAIRVVVDKSRADQWLGWRGEIFAESLGLCGRRAGVRFHAV